MKTFENSYSPNAENPYKDIASNTEQPTVDLTKEAQESADFEEYVNMQMKNERKKLEEAIAQSPRKGEIKKWTERAIAITGVMIALTSFSACTRGQIRAFDDRTERALNNGLTVNESRQINNRLIRNIDRDKNATPEEKADRQRAGIGKYY